MDNGICKTYRVRSVDGVRAIYAIANEYPMDIDASHDSYVVDCKSPMGLLSLGLKKSISITVHTDEIDVAEDFLSRIERALKEVD